MTPFTANTRVSLDRTRQAAPQVVEHLRERILALELKPGTTLSRTVLQHQFGVSQTPVRDALLKLEEEGLVAVFPQHATLVSRIDIDLARQAHFMRRAIETDAVRRLAEIGTPKTVEDMRAANAAAAEQARKLDHAAFLLADRAFHHTIFSHANIIDLWPIVRRNSGHLDRLRMLNLPNIGMERIVDMHEEIIDGIAAGDAGAAMDAMRAHLAGTLSMLDWVAREYPEFIES